MTLIPEDIVLEIFYTLDEYSLLRVLGVNRAFYNLAIYTLSARLNSPNPVRTLKIQSNWDAQRYAYSSHKLSKFFIKFVYYIDSLIVTCSSDNIINIDNKSFIKCSDDLVSLLVEKEGDAILIVTSYFNSAPASCVYRVTLDNPHRIDLLSSFYPDNWSSAHAISRCDDLIVYSSYNDHLHILNYKTNQYLLKTRHSPSDQRLSQLKLFNDHLLVLTKYSHIEFYRIENFCDTRSTKSSNVTSSLKSFRESDHCLEDQEATNINTNTNTTADTQTMHPIHQITQSTSPDSYISLSKFSDTKQYSDQKSCHLISMSKTHIHKTTFTSSSMYNPTTHHYPLQSPSSSTPEFSTDYALMTKGQFIDVSDTKYLFSVITGGYYPKCTVIDNNFNIVFPTTDAQHMGVITDAHFDDEEGKVAFCTSQGYVHVLDYMR